MIVLNLKLKSEFRCYFSRLLFKLVFFSPKCHNQQAVCSDAPRRALRQNFAAYITLRINTAQYGILLLRLLQQKYPQGTMRTYEKKIKIKKIRISKLNGTVHYGPSVPYITARTLFRAFCLVLDSFG